MGISIKVKKQVYIDKDYKETTALKEINTFIKPKEFVCIADSSKWVEKLGRFPLPIEVIPMARSYVARELLKLGGDPVWRQGIITDNGNYIIDIHGL